MSEDERAIRDVISTWLEASSKGDTVTVLGLMADDVIFLTPGREPFGKEAFAQAQNAFTATSMEAHSEVREVKVMGDWAFAWTDLTVVMSPPSGSPVRRHGNTLSIFRKLRGGKWVLARDANMLAVQS